MIFLNYSVILFQFHLTSFDLRIVFLCANRFLSCFPDLPAARKFPFIISNDTWSIIRVQFLTLTKFWCFCLLDLLAVLQCVAHRSWSRRRRNHNRVSAVSSSCHQSTLCVVSYQLSLYLASAFWVCLFGHFFICVYFLFLQRFHHHHGLTMPPRSAAFQSFVVKKMMVEMEVNRAHRQDAACRLVAVRNTTLQPHTWNFSLIPMPKLLCPFSQ